MAKLILIRHGQSIWNKENRFSGWADVPLSKKGIKEAKEAGKKLQKMKFDVAYTSELIRAQLTLFEVLEINNNDNKFFRIHDEHGGRYNKFLRKHADEMNYLKVHVSPALNERDYGDLEGLNKDETKKKFGEEQVHIWRRSYKTQPPGGESLEDTYKRTIPYFKKKVEKDLKEGKNVIIAAHGNSLRAVLKYIDKVPDKEINKVEISTGQPIIYNFDKELKVISKRTLKK